MKQYNNESLHPLNPNNPNNPNNPSNPNNPNRSDYKQSTTHRPSNPSNPGSPGGLSHEKITAEALYELFPLRDVVTQVCAIIGVIRANRVTTRGYQGYRGLVVREDLYWLFPLLDDVFI